MFTDFYSTDLRPGEIITAVHVPVPDPATRTLYAKFRSRSAEDRPCVSLAASLRLAGPAVESLSVVIGAVEATPQRRPEITAMAEGHVPGRRLAERIAQAYADAVDPLDDVRGSSWYRREIVRVLVRRSIETLARGTEAGHA
jgi:carbon-monoxide dehydrogenase medium subunit